MPKHVALNPDANDVHLNAAAAVDVAAPQQQQRSSRESLLLVMVAFQTGVLLAMAIAGIYAYDQVMSEAAKLQKVNDLIQDPALVFEANPHLSHSVATFLREVGSAFFLGSTNGTVSTFVEDIFETDFASVAGSLRPFVSSVANKFAAKQAEPQCNSYVQCESYGPLYCPNGPTRYCNGAGSVVNCGDCPYGEVVQYATTVESILTRVSELQKITPIPGNSAPAAFGEGVFRLNSILSWIGNQGNIKSWSDAAKACDELATSVAAVNWSGNYTSHNGGSNHWDANSDVSSVVKQARVYCPVIASIGTVASDHASAKAHKAPAQPRRQRKHAP